MFRSLDFVESGDLCRPNSKRPFDFVASVYGARVKVDCLEFDFVASVYGARVKVDCLEFEFVASVYRSLKIAFLSVVLCS